MSGHSLHSSKSIVPTAKDIKLAQQSSRILAHMLLKQGAQFEVMLEMPHKQQKTILLPAPVVGLLVDILAQMAEGNGVTVAPLHAELTTQEAADLLNVSRPYFIQLLNKKEIPFRKVGNRRKILVHDVMAYKLKTDASRRKVLAELAEEAQKLHLGY